MVHYFSHKKLSYVERVSNGNGSNKFEELFLSIVSNYSSTPIACFHAKANSCAWRGRKKTVRVGMSRGSAPQNGVPLHRLWNIIHLTKRWTEQARARERREDASKLTWKLWIRISWLLFCIPKMGQSNPILEHWNPAALRIAFPSSAPLSAPN